MFLRNGHSNLRVRYLTRLLWSFFDIIAFFFCRKNSSETSESEYSSSDEEVNIYIQTFICARDCCVRILTSNLYSRAQLQEAFAKGLLKPGLNAAVENKKQFKNCVVSGYFVMSRSITISLKLFSNLT